MKTTDQFKQTIKTYLDQRAQQDELFAVSYAKEGKNIDDCCTYILNTVQASGCTGFADAEIFGMAVHYYDEEKIEVGKHNKATVVVNHTIELTEQDMDEARQQAIEKVTSEQIAKLKAKPVSAIKDKRPAIEYPSLF